MAMGPDRYLNEIEIPIAEFARDVCDWEGLDQKYVLFAENDPREILKRLKEQLFQKRNTELDKKERDRLTNAGHCLQWLRSILNIKRHYNNAESPFVAISVAGTFEVLKIFEYRNFAAFQTIEHLNEELFIEIFSEYAENNKEDAKFDELKAQINALHAKLDRMFTPIASINGDQARRAPHGSKPQNKKQKLLDIRARIEASAQDRGSKMEGWEHLIQYRRIDDLIDTAPKSKDELISWARTLNSYPRNELIMKQQIEEWGDDIVAVFNFE